MTAPTSPSASIVAAAIKQVERVDAIGRKLTIKRLSVLEQARMLKAIGAEQSSNEAFVRIATFACMISLIDEVPYPMPTTAAEIEAAIARMGDEGYMTVMVQWSTWVKVTNDLLEQAVRSFETDVKN